MSLSYQLKSSVTSPQNPLVIAHNFSDDCQAILLSIIIPTFNEAGNIERLIKVLTDLLDDSYLNQYELIVVDDDSPDLTWQIAEHCAQKYPQVKVVRRCDESGLSTAVIRGWQAAQGAFLGVIDGDLQHPPATLLGLICRLENGADLAIASRHTAGGGVSEWSFVRRFLSRGAQLLGLMILPQVVGRVSDPMSGYFMVRREAIAERTLEPLGYKILIEVLGRGQINQIAEVPYVFQEREAGDSKVTSRQYIDYIRHLLRLRFSSGFWQNIKQRFAGSLVKFIRFGIVGFGGIFVDMAMLYLLFELAGLAMSLSALLATETAIVNNFIWNDHWTFHTQRRQHNTFAAKSKRLLKFNAICLVGLGIKLVLLNLFVQSWGWNLYLANLTAIALVTVWNFWLSARLGWRIKKDAA